jgi:hypothetical protein
MSYNLVKTSDKQDGRWWRNRSLCCPVTLGLGRVGSIFSSVLFSIMLHVDFLFWVPSECIFDSPATSCALLVVRTFLFMIARVIISPPPYHQTKSSTSGSSRSPYQSRKSCSPSWRELHPSKCESLCDLSLVSRDPSAPWILDSMQGLGLFSSS